MTPKEVLQILLKGPPQNDASQDVWDKYHEALREADRLAEESFKHIEHILAPA